MVLSNMEGLFYAIRRKFHAAHFLIITPLHGVLTHLIGAQLLCHISLYMPNLQFAVVRPMNSFEFFFPKPIECPVGETTAGPQAGMRPLSDGAARRQQAGDGDRCDIFRCGGAFAAAGAARYVGAVVRTRARQLRPW